MMGECAAFHDTQAAQEVSTTGTHGPFWAVIGDVLKRLVAGDTLCQSVMILDPFPDKGQHASGSF